MHSIVGTAAIPVGGKPDDDAAVSNSEDKFKCENCHYQHAVFVGLKEALEFSYSVQDGEQLLLDNGDTTIHKNESKLTAFPKHPDRYRYIVHLDIPISLEDPMHFGHVLYKTFTFIASLSLTQAATSTTAASAPIATPESAATVTTEAPATIEAAPLVEAESTLPTSKRTKSPKKNGKKSSKSTAV
jgi:hypothetical protein